MVDLFLNTLVIKAFSYSITVSPKLQLSDIKLIVCVTEMMRFAAKIVT